MAAGFVGLTIVVTLKTPANTVLQGLVADVHEQSSTLLLQNVVLLATGHRLPSLSVEGTQIADIKLVGDPSIPDAAPLALPDQPIQQSAEPPTTQSQAFVDPAILSFGKRPVKPVASVTESPSKEPGPTPSRDASSTPVRIAPAAPPPAITSPFVGKRGRSSPGVGMSSRRDSNVTAMLTTKVAGLTVEPDARPVDESDDPATVQDTVRRASVTETRTGKSMDEPVNGTDAQRRKRRSGKNKKKETSTEDTLAHNGAAEPEVSPEVRRTPASTRNKGAVRGDGWRDTPILQEEPTTTPRTPGVIGGKVGLQAVSSSKRKNRRQREMEAQSGWATEDATDIGQLPDFDFEGNLSKFDKRTVFDQIRNEDTTADEDRLVSFNRPPARPGTFGGQKLHPTEAVLDGKSRRRTSESSDSDDFDFDSGRNSRRAMSRASTKRAPHRSNSGLQEDNIPLNASTASLLSRSRRSLNNPTYSSSHATGSPRPVHFSPPASPSVSQPSQPFQSGFRLTSSNHTCPTITPGGMAAIEEIAEAEFGLSSDVQMENAARGIAELAMSALNPGGRRLARDNINAKPVVVVLAGNHRAGARAAAAARHLQARGVRVMTCVLGFERGLQDGDKDLRRQVELVRKMGGLVRGWVDVERYLKKLDAPPELIVDALLAPSRDFEALGAEDKVICLSMVGWANKSRAQVLSVDAPSGVNGSTGEISILEGEPLEVRAKFIVCIGAPHTGILRALQAGEGASWQLWVVDIGVNKAWKHYGTAGSRGVKFGMDWVAPLKFITGEGDGQ